MNIGFVRPEALYLFLLGIPWAALVWPRAGRGVVFSRGESARSVVGWWGVPAYLLLVLPMLLRALALAAIVVALAEPYRTGVTREIALRGKGIGLAVDLSSSMLAKDMEEGKDRITVAREAAIRFAERRPHDELSLIGFAGQPLTRVPPTTDPRVIVQGVETLRVQLVRDGTDISAALLTTVARLQESEREPRVVILLTDGAHNGVGVPPLTAARAAASVGVRVHAISVLGPEAGSRADVSRAIAAPTLTNAGDMRTVLQGIAAITGGSYFHASTGAALDSIYSEIDRLEQPDEVLTDVEFARPIRGWALLAAVLFLGIEGILRGSRYAVIP